VVIGLVVVVGAIFLTYGAAEPAILKIWPGLLATRHGPVGFLV